MLRRKLPKSGMDGLKENWKKDLFAGFLVFFVSLPLSLGVSMACNLPPFAGLITAIVGGLFISFFQGSTLSIKSSAAGLIILVVSAIQELGGGNTLEGYKLMLAVVVLSGILQMILGTTGVSIIADMMPSAAIHGLMAAIGLIIISKEIYTLLGVVPAVVDTSSLIINIPNAIANANPEITAIGIMSLLILFLFSSLKNKYFKLIPAPMVAIAVAIPLGHYLDLEHYHKYLFWGGHEYEIGPSFLVTLPDNLFEGITFPVFDKIFSLVSIKYTLLIAFVGSIESIVSARAIDNLDDQRRKSDLNKDIFANGLGNTICGFIGGIPMITEIVRSSYNVYQGAKTHWSSFFNGTILLLFLLLLPGLIHQIPLSALAALLIFIGIKLASPNVIRELSKVGINQLVIYFTTIFFTLAFNIIAGILSGITINILTHQISGVSFRNLFTSNFHIIKLETLKLCTIVAKDSFVFSNYAHFKNKIDRIPKEYRIVVDFSQVKLIDHTSQEHIYKDAEEYFLNGRSITIVGLENLVPQTPHPLSYKFARKENDKEVLKVSRENSMRLLSKKINWKFNKNIIDDSIYSTIRKENINTIYEENILSCLNSSYFWKVSDLKLIRGGDIKAGMYQMTILSIILPLELPKFSLKKEKMTEKIKDNTIFNDIDFAGFPIFSNKFSLNGTNEKSIRQLFSTELIQFMEEQNTYHLECFGKELLIYDEEKLLSVEEIENLIMYSSKVLYFFTKTQK